MKIPSHILRASDKLGDFLNITLYYKGGRLDIRVLDVITAVGAIVFTVYAYLTRGWLAAGQMALMCVFVTMCALWFFPSSKVMK